MSNRYRTSLVEGPKSVEGDGLETGQTTAATAAPTGTKEIRMRRRTWMLTGLLAAMAGVTTTQVFASDHDDGEPTSGTAKNRNLNLSDHFAFKSPGNPAEMAIISYTNPRSLPGHTYTLATNARYEQHVSKVSNKTD